MITFKFLGKSLDESAKITPEDKFRETSKYFNGGELDLVTKKDIYSYVYIDSIEKSKDTSLPGIKDFSNGLNKTNITSEDYEHAKKVWNTFGCKTMADYTRLYNQIDVLILTDVMYGKFMRCEFRNLQIGSILVLYFT